MIQLVFLSFLFVQALGREEEEGKGKLTPFSYDFIAPDLFAHLSFLLVPLFTF